MKGFLATISVYLSALYIRFGGSIQSVKEYILQMLLEKNISREGMIKAQRALDAFIKIISSEWDIKTFIEDLEESFYSKFREALYFYIRIDVNVDEIKRILQSLLLLRSQARDKTRKGSFKISSDDVSIEVRFSDLYVRKYDISTKRLKELGFFTINLLEELFYGLHTVYHIIIPAPYVDAYILRLFRV